MVNIPASVSGCYCRPRFWSVFPRNGGSQSLIVRNENPVRAQGFDLTLCFLSCFPKRYFGVFALAVDWKSPTDIHSRFAGSRAY